MDGDSSEYSGDGHMDVGVFSALYAAYLRPELRVTSSQLSAIINGVATILMFMFIDPYFSMLTDELVEGKVDDANFRRSIVWLTGSRIVGTVMAQFSIDSGGTLDRDSRRVALI